MGWQQPIVHFVFQTEELAERAHLDFGFTNTSAPFSVTSERVGAEYQVKFRYIGEAIFQPDQQLVVYYNGAPAGWLWILPYMVSGKVSWYQDWNPVRWQMQNALDPAIFEFDYIPGMPIVTQGNNNGDALQLTIDQPYAHWSDSGYVDVTFYCIDRDQNEVYKTFFNEDVTDVDRSGGDEMVIYFHNQWKDWYDEWGLGEVYRVAATLDEIIIGNFGLEMSFDVGSL